MKTPHVWKISKNLEETMEYNEKHIGSNLKFEFSIRNIRGEEPMKNIPLSIYVHSPWFGFLGP